MCLGTHALNGVFVTIEIVGDTESWLWVTLKLPA